MPDNYVLTGPPRSGKSTVIEQIVSILQEHRLSIGGIYCPELRQEGERVGFKIVDLGTGATAMLAHVDRETGPSVGKYRVCIDNLDSICHQAIPATFDSIDCIVVDEIAPMETHSTVFIQEVRRALNAQLPVIAVVHHRSTEGFIGEVKRRTDIESFEVTPETREELPKEISATILLASGSVRD